MSALSPLQTFDFGSFSFDIEPKNWTLTAQQLKTDRTLIEKVRTQWDYRNMTTITGSLQPRDTVFDSDDPLYELRTAYGVHAVKIGIRCFVYGSGVGDDGISGFELKPDGSMTNVVNVSDNSDLKLGSAATIVSTQIGELVYLYVAGSRDDGISVFKISPNGTLSSVQNVSDNSAMQLDRINGQMVVVEVEGIKFLIVSGRNDNGISVFSIDANGRLTNTDNKTDSANPDHLLKYPFDVASAVVDGKTLIFVAGTRDHGITVFQLSKNGKLTYRSNRADDETVNLLHVVGLDSAVIDGTTYLFATGGSDHGVSVFSIGADGALTSVFNIDDSSSLALLSPWGVTAFELDGETFISVCSVGDDALNLFHVATDGSLSSVAITPDSARPALNSVRYSDFVFVGGNPLLVAASHVGSALSSYEVVVTTNR